MKCKTPVTIIWRDPSCDWHWFWLCEYNGYSLSLAGADAPDGSKHDGDSFRVHEIEVLNIKQGHHKVKGWI